MLKNYISSIGEILLDEYENEKQIGGAPFNFIYHVKKLSGNVNFISAVGNDAEGKIILDFLKNENFPIDHIQVLEDKPTGKVIIGLNQNKIPQFDIRENAAYDFIELSAEVRNNIQKKSGLIYFGTLCQRNSISQNSINALIKTPVLKIYDVNIRQNFYTRKILETSLKACSILKVNEDELNLICTICLETNSSFYEKVKILMNKYKIKYLAVTKGNKGAELFSHSESNFCRTPKCNVVDTVGAGDAYTAILSLGIMNNLDLEETNYLAVSFASEVIKQKGALIRDEEIYDKFREKILNE
jgi:fructokinase